MGQRACREADIWLAYSWLLHAFFSVYRFIGGARRFSRNWIESMTFWLFTCTLEVRGKPSISTSPLYVTRALFLNSLAKIGTVIVVMMVEDLSGHTLRYTEGQDTVRTILVAVAWTASHLFDMLQPSHKLFIACWVIVLSSLVDVHRVCGTHAKCHIKLLLEITVE